MKIEALMIDTCRITRPGDGVPVFDEDTGQYTNPEPVVVYEGKCRIQVRSDINSNAVAAVIGEHEFTYRTGTLQLPIEGTGDVSTDSTAIVTACPLDADMVGRQLHVMAETKGKTHATHRRYRIREVVG